MSKRYITRDYDTEELAREAIARRKGQPGYSEIYLLAGPTPIYSPDSPEPVGFRVQWEEYYG